MPPAISATSWNPWRFSGLAAMDDRYPPAARKHEQRAIVGQLRETLGQVIQLEGLTLPSIPFGVTRSPAPARPRPAATALAARRSAARAGLRRAVVSVRSGRSATLRSPSLQIADP
jgi:hypothetical protein